MGVNRPPARQPDGEGTPDPGHRRTLTDLATRLEGIAATLRDHHQNVTRSWPSANDERVLIYWLANIEIVKQDIDLVQSAADRSSDTISGPSEPLIDLTNSLLDARKAVHAALRAFQAHDEAGQFEKQSDHYFKASSQLHILANRCQVLATHLRGPQSLPDAPI
jgi:hypothetical protein